MKMRLTLTIGILTLCFFVWVSSQDYYAQGRVLSPDEVSLFLKNVIEKTTPTDFWGIWRIRNYQKSRDSFYEVAYLKNSGFGWKNLSDETQVVVSIEHFRFVFDTESQSVVTVLPGFEIPFFPTLEDNIELFQENYLLEFHENQVLILNRETGKVVRAFSLDYQGALSSQIYFSPDGQAIKEGRFIIRDFSPDYEQLSFAIEALEKCLAELPAISVDRPREERILKPQILPPGYRLARVFMVRGSEGDVFQSLFSDGINSLSIFQGAYPKVATQQNSVRTLVVRKESDLSVLVGETRGFQVTLIGSVEPEVINEIFLSLNFEGGW